MSDPNGHGSEKTTHFGAETIAFSEKPGRVRDVFEKVAARYDLMNDVMSARVHRLWKDALVDWLAPRRGARHLDLAGGTGDIAMRILRRVGGDMNMVVCDFTEGMLREGVRRAEKRGVQAPVQWVCGDAMALPFADQSFDSATIAFGIRNVADPQKALHEIFRVLKTGGRFICLEFSRVRNPLLAAAYDVYSDHVIPRMGQVVANDPDSYRYLVESIRRFPDQEKFEQMMRIAGFNRVAHRNLSAGVAALHSGWRF
ncbi:MAG: bifunctional demethylmenaquinone methyltransferase/2-methoxy-6-polyprenyl-1,4-benzoquinol methylase UbiE [Neomegalonema sp.]|nr:bifunctional demethylmenaquinone methyltransferase/2-methoxy-6-polyprenyl-1,4-benzoquinol methylase UbiE [Neomegalonema sp.]